MALKTNAKEFSKKLNLKKVSLEELDKAIDSAALSHAKLVVSKIKVSGGYKNRTGKLSAGQKVELSSTNVLRFYNNVSYAPFLHNGTGLFGPKKTPILPKNGAYFTFKIGSQWIRCKSIKGIKPMKWFPKAWKKNLPSFQKKLSSTIKQLYVK